MTRLVHDWIKNMEMTVRKTEEELMMKTRLDYVSLAAMASGVAKEKIYLASEHVKVGVIPVTAGLGVINSFAESVETIIKAMNFKTFLTDQTDVSGIYEAIQRGAEIVFLADDNKFLAINLEKNMVVDNDIATAKGYIAALEGAFGSLKDKEVIVMGCGSIGQEMMRCLKSKQATPIAYDKNLKVLESVKKEGYKTLSNIEELKKYNAVLDATNEGEWLGKEMLNPKAWIAAPGVPLSFDNDALERHKDKLIHDYLQIGVATMLAMSCSQY